MSLALLSKIFWVLVGLLFVTGLGILTLIVEYARTPAEDAGTAATPAAPARTTTSALSRATTILNSRMDDEFQSTVRVRTGSGSFATLSEPVLPPPARREPTPSQESRGGRGGQLSNPGALRPSQDMRPSPAPGPGAPRANKSGTNLVINLPASSHGLGPITGRLEVIYGNFSPNDPRELEVRGARLLNAESRMSFSKAVSDAPNHVQLNHYTVSPTLQAEIVVSNGRMSLINQVPSDEADRYQTRINGTPLDSGEEQSLAPGDIISMGIFRLKVIA